MVAPRLWRVLRRAIFFVYPSHHTNRPNTINNGMPQNIPKSVKTNKNEFRSFAPLKMSEPKTRAIAVRASVSRNHFMRYAIAYSEHFRKLQSGKWLSKQ
jgi:hypothetical protein